ncbi:MAG: hypothetical protein CMK07_15705 [Ponticaulis sp.]|nr:hypothetical protein [Ponticaulis sp.]
MNKALLFSGLKIESEFPAMEAIKDAIITAILTPITFGLVLFIFPYFFQRDVLDRSFVVDAEGRKVGSLDCTVTLDQMIRHAIPWAIVSFCTFGVGFFVFQFRCAVFCYNHTEINWFEEDMEIPKSAREVSMGRRKRVV